MPPVYTGDQSCDTAVRTVKHKAPAMDNIEAIQKAAEAGDRLHLWRSIVSLTEAKTVCEVGVFRGEFAGFILGACDQVERYYMIDPWRNLTDWNKPANTSDARFSEIFDEAMMRTEAFASKRVVLRDTTSVASKQIDEHSLDCVYIDGDHTLRGITIDLIHMLPKVRHGGIIGGDDFTKNIWQHGVQHSPTEVFPFAVYFAEAMGVPILTLPYRQFCIVNQPEIGFQLIDLGGYSNLTPAQIYLPPNGRNNALKKIARILPHNVTSPIRRALKRP